MIPVLDINLVMYRKTDTIDIAVKIHIPRMILEIDTIEMFLKSFPVIINTPH